MNYINGKNALKLYIDDLISRIDHFEKRGQFDEAQKYIQNVSYLTSQLSVDGIITDPFTNQKYYLSTGELRGGVPAYAHECPNFKKANLYNTNEEIVSKEVFTLVRVRVCSGDTPLKYS
jgi:DNA modification methylase